MPAVNDYFFKKSILQSYIITVCDRMFEKFDALVGEDDKISKDDLMVVLKEELADVSVFDMMIISAEIIENNKYVQESYQEKSKKIYIDFFLNRVKEIRSNDTVYKDYFDKDDFIEKLNDLKDIYKIGSIDRKNKSPLINLVVSLYTTFVLDEPIHPIGTPFPGSLEVIMENGVYYCPVKEANMDTPNSVCRLCIAEQLDF
jgi:uncharacterized protein (UPF0305 family)